MNTPLSRDIGLSSQLFELAPDATLVIDNEGKIVLVNKQAECLFGYGREEILGKLIEVLIPDRFGHAHKAHREAYVANPCVRPMNNARMKTCGLHKDGSEFQVESQLSPVVVGEEYALYCVAVRALAAHPETGHSPRLTQNVEAFSQLASGIAHDLNNLLAVITGFTSLAMEDLDPDDPLRHELGLVHEAGEKSADLTRHLLALSRKQQIRPKLLDLNAAVAKFESRLRLTIEENIKVKVILDPILGWLEADSSQIDVIMVNLAVSARAAMPGGGILTIETKNAELHETDTKAHFGVVPGRYVKLAMTNTGVGSNVGISRDDEKGNPVFKSFFEKKPMGREDDLGLSTVCDTIKQCGGHIWIYGNPGEDSTVNVYLPRVEKQSAARRFDETAAELTVGSETILVVEDEEMVLQFVVRALQEKGYEVLTARHLVEALRVWENHQGPVDLLLTDLAIPGGTGVELAEQTAEMNPDRRLLYMSGYAEAPPHHNNCRQRDLAFLAKPFTASALTRKVREILDQPLSGSA